MKPYITLSRRAYYTLQFSTMLLATAFNRLWIGDFDLGLTEVAIAFALLAWGSHRGFEYHQGARR